MFLLHRRVMVMEGEEEYQERGEDFDDEKDAGVVCGVIVVEDKLAEVADGVTQQPYCVGYGGRQPEVTANPETENSEHSDGEIGHADFVFVWACRPTDGGRCLQWTKDVRVGREQPHESYIDEEEVEQEGSDDRCFAAPAVR